MYPRGAYRLQHRQHIAYMLAREANLDGLIAASKVTEAVEKEQAGAIDVWRRGQTGARPTSKSRPGFRPFESRQRESSDDESVE